MSLFFLASIWFRGGLNSVFVDTDFGRDLSELSKLWIGQKVIWLGPTLSPGFHASPLYYYLFFPALLLGKGSAYSLLIANAVLALIILGVLGNKRGTLLALIFIGLSPFYRSLVLHPGNGFTYALWLILALISLWFEFPLFISSVCLGISLSFHPAAIFVLPILLYEWIRRRHELKQMGGIVLGLMAPWAPIILFEIITKGFLFRQWMAHPNVGMKMAPSLVNIQSLLTSNTVLLILFFIFYFFLIFIGKGRERWWLVISSLGFFFFAFVSRVPSHYLLGFTGLLYFIVSMILVQRNWGRILLGIMSIIFLIGICIAPLPSSSPRSIATLQSIVEVVTRDKAIQKTDKIAVVAALDLENKVPQADDYRFLLRVKGYTVLDVVNYAQANKMIMFVENPKFDWKQWSTWETEQIGSKRIIQELDIQSVRVIIFEKN